LCKETVERSGMTPEEEKQVLEEMEERDLETQPGG